MDYAPLGKARFSIAHVAGGDVLIIPAVRNVLLALFLSVWLAGWTVGGIFAIATLSHQFQIFVFFWLGGWALGWAFAAAALVWMLAGRETLSFVGADLDVLRQAAIFSQRRLYRGTDVRQLAAITELGWPYNNGVALPFGLGGGKGSIRFTYGARTRYLAAGMDESEARQIVEWLRRRLPEA